VKFRRRVASKEIAQPGSRDVHLSSLSGDKGMLESLFLRARDIQQQDGLWGLFKHGCLFLTSPLYKRNLFYLYEKIITNEAETESQPRIDIKDIKWVAVSSNQQADELEQEGYHFRSHPTDWNIGLTTYRRWLDEGVIAFCTFVRKEFAAINWVIPSKSIQERVTMPLIINYALGEAFPRGAWVNPKYRGLGLLRYTMQKRDRYLFKMGIRTLRATVAHENTAGLGMSEAMGDKIYGRAQWIKILWWRFWKEAYEKNNM
jgi:hypothetical protein